MLERAEIRWHYKNSLFQESEEGIELTVYETPDKFHPKVSAWNSKGRQRSVPVCSVGKIAGYTGLGKKISGMRLS